MRIIIYTAIVATLVLGGIFLFAHRASAATLPYTTGLVFWMDASQITGKVNGDSVSTWNDASGNGYVANTNSFFNAPTYVASALNGKPALHFNAASTQGLRMTYTQPGALGGNEPWTMFAVGRLTGGTNARLVGAQYPANQNWLLGWWNGNENVAYYNGFVSDAGTGIAPTTNWRIYTGKGDATIPQGWLYVTDTSTGATSIWQTNAGGSANPNGGMAFSGYDSAGVSEISDGDIAEVIYFQGALSDTNRHLIETYLYNKYFVAPPSGASLSLLSGRITINRGSLRILK